MTDYIMYRIDLIDLDADGRRATAYGKNGLPWFDSNSSESSTYQYLLDVKLRRRHKRRPKQRRRRQKTARRHHVA